MRSRKRIEDWPKASEEPDHKVAEILATFVTIASIQLALRSLAKA